MNNNRQTVLKNILIDFFEKLNNGDKFSWEDIELNYKQIQPFIDLLYTLEDFPMDDSNDDIYRFVKSEKQTFDKYQIQNIVDIGELVIFEAGRPEYGNKRQREGQVNGAAHIGDNKAVARDDHLENGHRHRQGQRQLFIRRTVDKTV